MRRRELSERAYQGDAGGLRGVRLRRIVDAELAAQQLKLDAAEVPDRIDGAQRVRSDAIGSASAALAALAAAGSAIGAAPCSEEFARPLRDAQDHVAWGVRRVERALAEHLAAQRELRRQSGRLGGRGHVGGEPHGGHPHALDWSHAVDAAMARNRGMSRTSAYRHVARTWQDGSRRRRSWATIRDAVEALRRRENATKS